MNTEKQNENDAAFITLEVQKIVQKEIGLLRDLLSLLYDEANTDPAQNNERKKNQLRKKADLQKKLRLVRMEKEAFFENFFYNSTQDCDLHIQKDHLKAVKEEVEKKHLTDTITHKSHLNTQKLPQLESKKKLKTLLLTIEEPTEDKEIL